MDASWVYNPLRDAQLTAAMFLYAWSQYTLEVNTHINRDGKDESCVKTTSHYPKIGISAPRLTLSSKWFETRQYVGGGCKVCGCISRRGGTGHSRVG